MKTMKITAENITAAIKLLSKALNEKYGDEGMVMIRGDEEISLDDGDGAVILDYASPEHVAAELTK